MTKSNEESQIDKQVYDRQKYHEYHKKLSRWFADESIPAAMMKQVHMNRYSADGFMSFRMMPSEILIG